MKGGRPKKIMRWCCEKGYEERLVHQWCPRQRHVVTML